MDKRLILEIYKHVLPFFKNHTATRINSHRQKAKVTRWEKVAPSARGWLCLCLWTSCAFQHSLLSEFMSGNTLKALTIKQMIFTAYHLSNNRYWTGGLMNSQISVTYSNQLNNADPGRRLWASRVRTSQAPPRCNDVTWITSCTINQ
jgi:hypothetical protein